MTQSPGSADGVGAPRCLAERSARRSVTRRPPTGVPTTYADGLSWLAAGASRHKGAAFLGLLFGWTGMWILLWTTAIAVVLGPILVAVGALPHHYLQTSFTVGVGFGAFVAVLVTGVGVGILWGFVVPFLTFFVARPFATAVAVAFGALFSFVLVFFSAAFERTSMRLRGYRRLSQEEIRRVGPVANGVAKQMGLGTLPRFALYDNPLPNAWAGARTIVLTSGLLTTLDDEELKALLAHELAHWRAADAVGQVTVWACSLPLALMVNLGRWLSAGMTQPWMALAWLTSFQGDRGVTALTRAASAITAPVSGLLRLLGWILFWPGMVLTRFIITPATAATMRRREYEADAVVADLGLAPAWISGLPKIAAFEGGRTGWEATLARTHPPTALRIERMEARLADDRLYQEQELDGAAGDALRLFGQLFTKPH